MNARETIVRIIEATWHPADSEERNWNRVERAVEKIVDLEKKLEKKPDKPRP